MERGLGMHFFGRTFFGSRISQNTSPHDVHPFTIGRLSPDSEVLPMSHTCFNQLIIPEYSSRQKMARKLEIAIRECEGFGLK